MKKLLGILVLGLLLSSNAYAFLIKSGEENLPIITDPPGAQCELKNNKGAWSVVTPGEVIVKRSKQHLKITCIKDGYTKFERFYVLKDPKTKLDSLDAFNDSMYVLGDLARGDAFWTLLDTASGSFYKYATYATHKKSGVPYGKGFIYIKLFTGIDPDFIEDDQ